MSEEAPWAAYGEWHELLDVRCVKQGNLHNMRLAIKLCVTSGDTTKAAFETALKNLNKWWRGRLFHSLSRRTICHAGCSKS
jgi:hypothetical protein